MRKTGQHTYKTMRGREIDMDVLRKKNELVAAVGNARVNARGDELGAGGKIVRKREDIVNDYYKSTQGVPNEPAASEESVEVENTDTVVDTESKQQPKAESKQQPKVESKSTRKKVEKPAVEEEQKPTASEEAEWEENEEGDFVKKGE